MRGIRLRVRFCFRFCVRSLLPLLAGLFCVSAWAADCSTYRGAAAALPKDVGTSLDKVVAAVHAHNVRNLYANSDRKVLLIRRMVSSDDRSGNFRLELRQRDFDSALNIRMINQSLPELSRAEVFGAAAIENGLTVRRDICEDARKCDDLLPGSEQLPFMLNDLLQCNQYAKGAYVYDDGLYLIDMVGAPGKLPVGTALFFNKAGSAYRLAGVIILN